MFYVLELTQVDLNQQPIRKYILKKGVTLKKIITKFDIGILFHFLF